MNKQSYLKRICFATNEDSGKCTSTDQINHSLSVGFFFARCCSSLRAAVHITFFGTNTSALKSHHAMDQEMLYGQGGRKDLFLLTSISSYSKLEPCKARRQGASSKFVPSSKTATPGQPSSSAQLGGLQLWSLSKPVATGANCTRWRRCHGREDCNRPARARFWRGHSRNVPPTAVIRYDFSGRNPHIYLAEQGMVATKSPSIGAYAQSSGGYTREWLHNTAKDETRGVCQTCALFARVPIAAGRGIRVGLSESGGAIVFRRPITLILQSVPCFRFASSRKTISVGTSRTTTLAAVWP